jgi:hypothetical protein
MDTTYYKANLENKTSQEIHLSIEITNTVINLALLDVSTNTYFGIESIKNHINFIDNSKLLQNITPKSVSCSLNSLNFTLVPKSLFEEDELETHIKFSIDDSENKAMFSYSEKQNITTCFTTNEQITDYLLLKFPNIEFKHLSSILIDSVTQGVHINFSSSNSFECLFVNEKGLLFYNGYEYSTPEETLYYLSLVCDKFDLDVQKIKTSVSGTISNEVINLWDDYIPKNNLHYKTIFEYYSFSNSLLSLDKHKYFSLIKQHTCV